MAKNGYIVGIDIGTKKVTALIGELAEERKIEVIGIGLAESKGLRKGVVVNLEVTSEAIKKARQEAELMAGVNITSAFLGISGAHIKSFNSRGVIAVSGRNREISQNDIRRVIEQSKAVSIPPDREIIHVIPQEFIVDDQDGIREPLGMNGIKLEVNVHIVTGATTLVQNLRTCVERAGVEIEEIVLNQIADSLAVLTPDERELGVGLIDIGAGTTEVAIFERGSLWYTSIIPLGGDNFTNDIAVGLRTAIPDAEKIKKKFGCVVSPPGEEQETIEVPSVGKGRKPRVLSRQLLAEIIQPRAEEIFRLVDNDIKRMGYEKSLNSGVVLTGGTALLEGLEDVAEEIFDLPVRRGDPTGVGGLVDRVNTPDYATAIGLLFYGRGKLAKGGRVKDRKKRFWPRVKSRVKEIFQFFKEE
jgi:cell division protein FtsA